MVIFMVLLLDFSIFSFDFLGGLQPKKTERYRKFQIWDWFFSVFFWFFSVFSVFSFWPILTGLTASC